MARETEGYIVCPKCEGLNFILPDEDISSLVCGYVYASGRCVVPFGECLPISSEYISHLDKHGPNQTPHWRIMVDDRKRVFDATRGTNAKHADSEEWWAAVLLAVEDVDVREFCHTLRECYRVNHSIATRAG